MSLKNSLWVEKYRPTKVSECILPADIKKDFQSIVDSGTMQNLLLTGTAGIGKTTIAKAMCDEMGCDTLIINASLDNGIDVIRSQVTQFASSLSMGGNSKVVIFDEADYLNPNSTQPSLRGFIESFHNNCRFIFTCNFKNRLIEPIHSRCTTIDFKIANKDKPKLAGQFFKRISTILENEGITYDEKVVVELITKHFPDFRRIINELQRYSSSGTIDSGILLNIGEASYKELFENLKNKNFNEVRKWVAKNSDASASEIFRTLYDMLNNNMVPASIPQAILIFADYGYKDAFCVDKEINITAAMVELMGSCQFK